MEDNPQNKISYLHTLAMNLYPFKIYSNTLYFLIVFLILLFVFHVSLWPFMCYYFIFYNEITLCPISCGENICGRNTHSKKCFWQKYLIWSHPGPLLPAKYLLDPAKWIFCDGTMAAEYFLFTKKKIYPEGGRKHPKCLE